MSANDNVFQWALSTLLTEIIDGPPGRDAFVLNPGDPGLLRQLDSLDAAAASSRPMPGKTTIASHADHVRSGFTLMNRWAAGEPNPFANADWNASWARNTVTVEEWQSLRNELRQQTKAWQESVASRIDWDDTTAAGSLASAAHTAYHLGAIRQILAAQGRPPAA